MSEITPQNRLCEEILGGNLSVFQSDVVSMSMPINYSDIDAGVLRSAQEAIYDMSAEQVRQTLPFVLDSIERNRTDLFETGYFNSFLLHVNYDFYLPSSTELGARWHFSSEYKRGFVTPTVSAMSRLEHGWALDWILDILKADDGNILYMFERDLLMFSRILSMALDKPESEAPTLKS